MSNLTAKCVALCGQTEIHPYNSSQEIPEGTHSLIVGTAPPPRFSRPVCECIKSPDFEFFYGSRTNFMWRHDGLLPSIALELDRKELFPRESLVDEKSQVARDFLERHNLWMIDVLQKYQRNWPAGSECSADDKYIKWNLNDCTCFKPIFDKCLSLSRIAFTSKNAASWTLQKLLKEQLISDKIEHPANRLKAWSKIQRKPGDSFERFITTKFKTSFWEAPIAIGRSIKFYILPMPTRMSGGVKGLDKYEKIKIYRDILFQT